MPNSSDTDGFDPCEGRRMVILHLMGVRPTMELLEHAGRQRVFVFGGDVDQAVDGCCVVAAAQVDEDRHALLVGQASTQVVGELPCELFVHDYVRLPLDRRVGGGLPAAFGEAMVGINVEDIAQPHRLAERGW